MKSNKNDNAIQGKKIKKNFEERDSSLTGEVRIGNNFAHETGYHNPPRFCHARARSTF